MLTKLIIKNFKKIKDQEYDFTNFDLLVGQNNSGKSTILQALAIWQYCIDEFHRTNRKGKRGIQIVLPNFTALPLSEFNLLWTERIVQKGYPKIEGKKQEYISIEISVQWRDLDNKEFDFGVLLGYQSPQSAYAKPKQGWEEFRELDRNNKLPRIVYVPPFSGIEPKEKWVDNGNVRESIGKAQPGSVIRNLLFRVIDRIKEGTDIPLPVKENTAWKEIVNRIYEWFHVDLKPPDYQKGVSTEIKVSFKEVSATGKKYDIIAGGSGFHQILTLMAFLYGYSGITSILFDEPDAHLHVNLQRTILNYLKTKTDIQFIIATHAEEFIKGVDNQAIISILSTTPQRIQSTPLVITALSDVDNLTVTSTTESSFILYVEGEDDERILNAWSVTLGMSEILKKFYIKIMGGGSKEEMKAYADKHFKGLRQIVPKVSRMMLFDYDTEDGYHPTPDDTAIYEWKRKNIENYLLVPEAWIRAIKNRLNIRDDDLFLMPYRNLVDSFFAEQNLTLPKNSTWETVRANVFEVVDGKKILFEMDDSLFQRILRESMLGEPKKIELKINRESVSIAMQSNEIHQDIKQFFNILRRDINEI